MAATSASIAGGCAHCCSILWGHIPGKNEFFFIRCDLIMVKYRVQNIKNYVQAEQSVTKILQINPNNTEANSLAQSLITNTAKNAISINYYYTHLEKQFADDYGGI